MKGPGLRVRLDVRRLWVCPQCGRRVRAVGSVTSRVCTNPSHQEAIWMQLVEERPQPPTHAPPTEPPAPAASMEIPPAPADESPPQSAAANDSQPLQ